MVNKRRGDHQANPYKPEKVRSRIGDFYEMVERWMRPNPKHAKVVQILLFILKIPVLVLVLTLSPILLFVFWLVLVVAL